MFLVFDSIAVLFVMTSKWADNNFTCFTVGNIAFILSDVTTNKTITFNKPSTYIITENNPFKPFNDCSSFEYKFNWMILCAISLFLSICNHNNVQFWLNIFILCYQCSSFSFLLKCNIVFLKVLHLSYDSNPPC